MYFRVNKLLYFNTQSWASVTQTDSPSKQSTSLLCTKVSNMCTVALHGKGSYWKNIGQNMSVLNFLVVVLVAFIVFV